MNNNNRQSPETARKLARLFIYGGIIVVLVLIPLLVSPYVTHVFVITFIYIVATVSLRTVIISGQYPLAHGAFMGIGAYTSAVAAKLLGWPVGLTIPLGGDNSNVDRGVDSVPFCQVTGLLLRDGEPFLRHWSYPGYPCVNEMDVWCRWSGGYPPSSSDHFQGALLLLLPRIYGGLSLGPVAV